MHSGGLWAVAWNPLLDRICFSRAVPRKGTNAPARGWLGNAGRWDRRNSLPRRATAARNRNSCSIAVSRCRRNPSLFIPALPSLITCSALPYFIIWVQRQGSPDGALCAPYGAAHCWLDFFSYLSAHSTICMRSSASLPLLRLIARSRCSCALSVIFWLE